MLLSRHKAKMVRHAGIEFLGWCGVAASLVAYTLITFEILVPSSITYLLLNLFAGIALGIETFVHKDFQPFWLNVIWGGIALLSLIRVLTVLS